MGVDTGLELRDGVRRGTRHPSLFRRTPYRNDEWYDPGLLGRARDYIRPVRRVRRLQAVVNLLLAAALVLLQVGPRVVAATHALPWPAQFLAVFALTTLISTMVGLPFGYWFEMVHDRRWGFSTQGLGLWVRDQVKGLLLGICVGGVLLLLLFAVIRATPLWWVWGGLGVGGVALLFSFIFPVVILPMFYKQKPVEGELGQRIARVAALAGVSVRRAYVMDASSRSTRDNAFVGGLGRTKRVVVFDTILEHPAHVLDNVVAHELGHYRLRHIVAQVPFIIVLSVVQFGVIAMLAAWPPLLNLAGVSRLGDPAALPLFSLLSTLVAMPFGLLQAWFGRVLERQADLEALELLGDPGAFIDVWRRLTSKNLGDLEPTWYSRAGHGHPENSERMAFGKAWAELNGVPIAEPAEVPQPLEG